MKEKVKALEPWYQTIKISSDLTTPGRRECGDHLWGNIKQVIPNSFVKKRILDLGCNAGRYCIGAAMLGASEVIGIEIKMHWYSQAVLVRDWFQKRHERSLPITYILGDMRKEIDSLSGKFDMVLAISSMYYLKTGREEFLEKLCKLTDCVLCGYRPKQEEEYFTRYFAGQGLTVSSVVADVKSERYLVLYKR